MARVGLLGVDRVVRKPPEFQEVKMNRARWVPERIDWVVVLFRLLRRYAPRNDG